jgi:hypothetical protein
MRYSASEKLEIIRTVETSALPVRRARDKDRHPKSQRSIPGSITTLQADSMRSMIIGPIQKREDRPTRPRRAGSLPARGGRRFHRQRAILRLGSPCLQALEFARPRHVAGIHRHKSGRQVRQLDNSHQSALADRLHLPQGHRLSRMRAARPK